MTCPRSYPASLLLLVFLQLNATAQKSSMLPHSVHEVEGVSSNSIIQFLDVVTTST